MRIKSLGALLYTLFFLLGAGLFYIQIVKGPYYQDLSAQNRIRLLSTAGLRGRIYDRNNALLVDTRVSFDAAVITQELKDKDAVFKILGETLDIPAEKLKTEFNKNFVTPFQPVRLVSDIGKKKAIILEEKRLDLPGIIVETRPVRRYIYARAGSHIFGYVGRINQRELARLRSYGYNMDDFIGKTGIECAYDNYLKGRHGGKQIEVDSKGYQVDILGVKEQVKGKDIFLTIDMRLQQFIEALFEGARGVVCVMDPRDGQMLGLVSVPSFDPNVFVAKDSSAEISALLKDKDYPLLNRAVQCAYPPGSVFKIVTSASGLETGKISAESTFSCAGSYTLGRKTFRCWNEKGHGEQAIRDAIKNSCNVFFYQLGRLVGVDDLANFTARFGFGRPTGIDLPGEAAGLVPGRMWKLLKYKEPWYEGETLNYAIGQGYVLVTPLQIAGMVCVIANGGYLVKPYLVRRIENVVITHTEKRDLGISPKTLGAIKDGMVKVVNDPDGTGRKAVLDALIVAGKTGTAQTSTEKTHAWFAGFAPADDPKAAVVVFLEYGGKGGLAASKAAGDIFRELRELGYL